ncbi:DUF305 domain-containing protein [Escherichia coli]|nr:DUF305 domain-containing protein [Escherichia coli]ELG8157451.1 DUF305 domain-containing protein [Salmonella enterica]EFB6639454.1 DUF305 domain-containing protein [Escherichia coli]EFC2602454.1 DUF305 domain-containing protein [Escherichia coli]EFH0085682.1 DUF305 domain-containing protein [Escherichia coli]
MVIFMNKRIVHLIYFLLLLQPLGISYASVETSKHKSDSEAVFEKKMHETMNKMHHEMLNYKVTGDKELDFLKMMIPHHQAAIDMSRVILETSEDREVRNLAYSIITEQNNEINIMNKLIEGKKHEIK